MILKNLIMSNSCFILTHYFVRDHEHEKLEMIEFAIKHIKLNNPDKYIILAGHGQKPKSKFYDYIIWNKKINESDLGMGHPKLSFAALMHAKLIGFKKALKIPLYTIILDKNIDIILDKFLNKKKLLITQETEIIRKRIGDLFMYGDIDFLINLFDFKRWYELADNGLDSFGKIFDEKLNSSNKFEWFELLKKYCEFENIYNLKWIDLRVSWHEDLKFKTNKLLKNDLQNYHEYLWGNRNGVNLIFDKRGNILEKGNKNLITKVDWNNY